MLGFHHALDHLEGRRLGVAAIMGPVSDCRVWSNHVATTSSTCDGWKDAIEGVSSSHGVRSQLGEDWASFSDGGEIFVQMTVWSEPEEGRLDCQE